jgi:type IX secretion system PorP/SprF family membrane protein
MKKNSILLSLACICFTNLVFGQDLHFSQYSYSPLNLNPALTGVSNGDIRLVSNYRNQWQSISSPYRTISASYDMSLYPKESSNDFFGVGIVFDNDKAGTSKLGYTQTNLSGSYSKSLNGNLNNFITFGFQAGFGQRSMSYDALSWDSQFNGNSYDPTLPSNETSGSVARAYSDFSAGLLYSYANENNQFRMNMGTALFHLNSPDVSLNGTKDKLSKKVVVHGNFYVRTSSTTRTTLIPNFVYTQQASQKLLNLGLNAKYLIQDRSKYTGNNSEIAFYLGGMYRVGDAFVICSRFDYGSFAAALSYDVNISGLTLASNSRGGTELVLMYTRTFRDRKKGGSTVRFF